MVASTQAEYKLMRCCAVVLTAAAMLFAGQCAAQSAWKPERTVEIVVGSAAGGGNDKVARTLQRIWQESKLLDNVVVVNRVGGGGAVAYAYTNQTPGDGHRIVVARTGLLSNQLLGLSPLSYTDTTPLALVADEMQALTVRADSQIRTAKDLIARWNADPQSVSISLGSSRGSTAHYVVAQIAKIGNVDPRKLKLLTFGGNAESITNLLGGHIDMTSGAIGQAIEHHRAGKMRVIGLSTVKRSNQLPEVTTFREQGLDVVVPAWTAIVGAKDLTPAQIAYWENMLERAVNHPRWKGGLEEDSVDWVFMKSQPTRDFLRKDYEKIRGLLADIGMAK
jgi:putative tricarboxylic transport membrane protein